MCKSCARPKTRRNMQENRLLACLCNGGHFLEVSWRAAEGRKEGGGQGGKERNGFCWPCVKREGDGCVRGEKKRLMHPRGNECRGEGVSTPQRHTAKKKISASLTAPLYLRVKCRNDSVM